MRRFLRISVVTAALVSGRHPRAHAQVLTGDPVVDSASVARAAWARARRAASANDVSTEASEIAHAASAWPSQGTYQLWRALSAGLARDTSGVIAGLTAFADLGLARDFSADSSFAPWLRQPDVEQAVQRIARNGVPMVASAPIARLLDSTFFPEGMDADARTGRFYVGSVRHRTIAEVSPDGQVRELLPRDAPGMGAILGVRAAPDGNFVWATTSGLPYSEGYTAGDSAIASLLKVRRSDGAIVRRWSLPVVNGGHVLGDLAIGPQGDVWMTDSSQPVLYRLRPNGDTLEAIRSPLFRSLQGMAPTPDGRTVYVADYAHGLLRVDAATHRVTHLLDAPRSTSLGCDGIAWDRGAIVAVQNGTSPARIMRFVLDAAGTRIVSADLLDRNTGVADEPTIGAVVGGKFVYVANSQWEKYDEAGVRRMTVPLSAPVLLAVPLPPDTRH
ncbi:MAG: hypothetical protein JWO05_1897 [Gemmatimonadetes bacterium]|nr:hypothetical protein [Gemmatimonadota bacterium]